MRPLDGGRYSLVAGLHRLRAFGILARGSIPVRISGATTDDEARLAEVMENLGRQDLIALDRCQHLWERKAIWLKLYPQAKAGGARLGSGRPLSHSDTGMSEKIKSRNPAFGIDEAADVFGFDKSVAEKVGLGAPKSSRPCASGTI